MRLTDDELRDVLARAEEIQRASLRGDELNAELEAVVGAAGEVGIARHAVERALRERVDIFATPPAVGTQVFAKSADGKFYVADVLSVADEGIGVRFLRGSEHLVAHDQVKPCVFIPGERVMCNWPWWGPWTCTVVAYDAAKQRLRLDDRSGTTKTFPVSEVWLPPARKADGGARTRVYVTLLAAGAAVVASDRSASGKTRTSAQSAETERRRV
jgi:hypothetical protein